MIYSINYDLHRPGQNYSELHDAIKSCGAWWHHLDSHWLVDTTLTAKGVWDKLSPHVDTNDHFLIIGITQEYSGWLPQKAWDWINSKSHNLAA
jgi:hypothetical protein